MNRQANVHSTVIEQGHSILCIDYWLSPFDADDFDIRRVEMLGDKRARNLLGACQRHKPWMDLCVAAVVRQIGIDG